MVSRICSDYGPGLGADRIHYGPRGCGNSGYQAVNLAYLLGAEVILLLGFDMAPTGHFFGEHPHPLNNASPYGKFIEAFETIDTPGLQVINCTPGSALDCFPRANLRDVI